MPKVHRKVRREKERIVAEFNDLRGLTGNGKVFCGPKGGVIDLSVCIVAQTRTPAQCSGCKEYRR